jgi:hypothetical protein
VPYPTGAGITKAASEGSIHWREISIRLFLLRVEPTDMGNALLNPFHSGGEFRGFHDSHICYGLPVCLPPCTDPTGFPAVGDFYYQTSNGSVAHPPRCWL